MLEPLLSISVPVVNLAQSEDHQLGLVCKMEVGMVKSRNVNVVRFDCIQCHYNNYIVIVYVVVFGMQFKINCHSYI